MHPNTETTGAFHRAFQAMGELARYRARSG